MSDPRLDRRTALRGFGAAVALPWLDAMVSETSALAGSTALSRRRAAAAAEMAAGTAQAAGTAAASGAAPVRMVHCFVPNGVDPGAWFPAGDDAAASATPLPTSLEPLEGLRDRFTMIRGLSHDNARAKGDGPGDHARSSACFLTGAHPVKTAGDDIAAGVSVDQIAAQRIGNRTPLASLELGCEPALRSGNCDSGYSCAYSANISWRSPTQPNLKEVRPRAVFERLFAMGPEGESAKARARRLTRRKSILDYVSGDARRLESELGVNDRHRMGEYLESVRALEKRVEAMERATDDPSEVAGFDVPRGVPGDYREHVRLMNELIVLALRTDRTRVATFMLANEGSNRPFPFLDVAEGHHHLSHHGGDESMVTKIQRINRFQSELFADLVRRMDEVDEPGGSLLDHSMVLFGSAIRDGNRHDHHDLPVLLAGGGGGTLRPGRVVTVPKKTPMCNLLLSMLHRMEVQVPSFGDSTGELAEI
ncbi:MAG: DUF1552 domain-containing protein [Phycisphaerales bacterium]